MFVEQKLLSYRYHKEVMPNSENSAEKFSRFKDVQTKEIH